MPNKGHKQTFEGGMDQDVSFTKFPPNKYYSATNYRLTVDDTGSQYNLTTIGGLTHKVTLPGAFGLPQTRYAYKGHTFVRDKLVLFVTYILSTGTQTDYVLYFDPSSPPFTTGTTLDLSSCTIYAGSLGFYNADYVSAVGIRETATKERVYFAVEDQPVRSLSLVDGDLSAVYSEEDLQLVIPGYSYNIELTDILEGGSLKAGKVQYAFSLTNTNGVESLYFPATELITIVEGSVKDASEYLSIRGGTDAESCGKSVKITITNSPSTDIHEKITVIGIYYLDGSVAPSVKVIGTYSYSDSLIVTDTGANYIGELTIQEYTQLRNLFEAATLETKNNYLFAANITEQTLEVDYDARAYRFNSSGIAKTSNLDGTFYYIYESGAVLVGTGGNAPFTGYWEHIDTDDSTLLDANTGSVYSLPETADLITPDADPSNDFPGSSAYKSGYDLNISGATGATGPNVSYTIDTSLDDVREDAINTTDIFNGYQGVSGYDSDNGLGQVYQFNTNAMRTSSTGYMHSTVDNYASPFRIAYDLSFRRDEVYRIGVVFFDKYGRATFVKWIGDVRMPSAAESFIIDTSGGNIDMVIMRMSVSVKYTQALADAGITGFQIVHVERTNSNSTILDNGYIGSLEYHSPTEYIFPTSMLGCLNGAGTDLYLFNGDISTYNTAQSDLSATFKEYISPEINYNKTNLSLNADYFIGYKDTVSYISCYNTQINDATVGASPSTRENYNNYVLNFKRFGSTHSTNNISKLTIDDHKLFSDTSYAAANDAAAYAVPLGSINVVNHSKGAGTNTAVSGTLVHQNEGARGTCIIVDGTISDYTGAENGFTTPAIPATNGAYREAAYVARKQSIVPYGGLGYNARANSSYIPLCGYTEFTVSVGSSQSKTVGGDTYIGMFEHLRTMLSDFDEDSQQCSGIEVVYMPCESSLNIVLRTDTPIYKGVQELSGTGRVALLGIKETAGAWPIYDPTVSPASGTLVDTFYQNFDLYDNNDAYSRNMDARSFIAEPLFWDSTDESDVKVLVSEHKIMNESVDSWSRFLYANELELDSKYGAITRLHVLGDNLIALQPSGVAYLAVAEREQVITSAGFSLGLGTGGILTRRDYISTNSGSSDYFGSIVTPTGLYYFDRKVSSFNILSDKAEPTVDKITGMNTFFKAFKNSSIHRFYSLGYDRAHNEILFNYTPNTVGTIYTKALVYNELARAFVGFHYYGQTISNWNYISNDEFTWTLNITTYGSDLNLSSMYNSDSDIGIDGTNAHALILILNPNQGEVSRFDSLEWDSVVQNSAGTESSTNTFSQLLLSNEYQTTSTVTSTNFKRRFRNWRCNALRDNATNSPRIRDTYGKLTLYYTIPTTNYRLSIDSLKLYYQPNKR